MHLIEFQDDKRLYLALQYYFFSKDGNAVDLTSMQQTNIPLEYQQQIFNLGARYNLKETFFKPLIGRAWIGLGLSYISANENFVSHGIKFDESSTGFYAEIGFANKMVDFMEFYFNIKYDYVSVTPESGINANQSTNVYNVPQKLDNNLRWKNLKL